MNNGRYKREAAEKHNAEYINTKRKTIIEALISAGKYLESKQSLSTTFKGKGIE